MNPKVQLPPSVSAIFRKFSQGGYEIYLVGGAVRDILLGKITDDWDFATNATPEEIKKSDSRRALQ